MQKFTVLRNDAYGHVDTGVIPNKLYEFYKQDIEENIMVLAIICSTNKAEILLKGGVKHHKLFVNTFCITLHTSFSS
jgi:hypothetical protein